MTPTERATGIIWPVLQQPDIHRITPEGVTTVSRIQLPECPNEAMWLKPCDLDTAEILSFLDGLHIAERLLLYDHSSMLTADEGDTSLVDLMSDYEDSADFIEEPAVKTALVSYISNHMFLLSNGIFQKDTDAHNAMIDSDGIAIIIDFYGADRPYDSQSIKESEKCVRDALQDVFEGPLHHDQRFNDSYFSVSKTGSNKEFDRLAERFSAYIANILKFPLYTRPQRAINELIETGFLNDFISSLQLPSNLDQAVYQRLDQLLHKSAEQYNDVYTT